MCNYAHSNIEIHHLNFSSRNMVLILDWWIFTNYCYFQGQRSRSPGQIFRRGDMPRFALPLLYFSIAKFIFVMKWKTNTNTTLLFYLFWANMKFIITFTHGDQFESVQTISLENKTNNKIRIEHLEYTVSQNIRLWLLIIYNRYTLRYQLLDKLISICISHKIITGQINTY